MCSRKECSLDNIGFDYQLRTFYLLCTGLYYRVAGSVRPRPFLRLQAEFQAMGPYYTLCILLLNYLRNVDIFLTFLCPYCTILGFSLPHSPFFLVEASGLHKKYTLISLLPNFVKKRRNFLNLIRNKIMKYKRLSLELYFFNIKNIFILTIHFS